MGDVVTAYDPATGKASVQTVQQTFINHDNNLLAVTLRTVAGSSAAASNADPHTSKQKDAALAAHGAQAPPNTDETIQTTTNHPWLTADHGWILASFLHVGEPVQRVDGSTAVVVAVRAEPGAAAMWDLTVSNMHTFAVGSGAYVVHNCGPVRTVAQASRDLDAGATEAKVASRSDAEDLFLRKYAGRGFKNSTALDKDLAGGMTKQGAQDFFGKEGYYHWDDAWDPDDPGRLLGHGADNPHGGIPHLEINPPKGSAIRIFFN